MLRNVKIYSFVALLLLGCSRSTPVYIENSELDTTANTVQDASFSTEQKTDTHTDASVNGDSADEFVFESDTALSSDPDEVDTQNNEIDTVTGHTEKDSVNDSVSSMSDDSDALTADDSEAFTTDDSEDFPTDDSDSEEPTATDSETNMIDSESGMDEPYRDLPLSSAFVTRWQTDREGISDNNQVQLPLVENGDYDFLVEWGDGTWDVIQRWDDASSLHEYALPGTYDIQIRGTFAGWRFVHEEIFYNAGASEEWYECDSYQLSMASDSQKIVDVLQWGAMAFGDTSQQFAGACNLQISALDAPDLSRTTSLRGAFGKCQTLAPSPNALSLWDTSTITDMSDMFYEAALFNADIGNWKTDSVVYMQEMFLGAARFNQDLHWNTANVIRMDGMFDSASDFNGDIGGWDITGLSSLEDMFKNAQSFNCDLSSWNTANITSMLSTFSGAVSFNGDIGEWDVRNVWTMAQMFNGAVAFNQDISEWKTVSLSNTENMFTGAASFNQVLSDWDTSNITNMAGMFAEAASFDQDVSTWNTSNVTDMEAMFMGEGVFEHDISSWDFSQVRSMWRMFSGRTLSTPNYNALLVSLANQAGQEYVGFDGGNSVYTFGAASDARETLIDQWQWTIRDGGMASNYTYPDAYDPAAFVTLWRTDNIGMTDDNQIHLPMVETGSYNFLVQWGDGTEDTITEWDAAETTHTYEYPARYEVRIIGEINGWRFPPTDIKATQLQKFTTSRSGGNGPIYFGDERKLIDIINWGELMPGEAGFSFYLCGNLRISAVDAPNLTQTKSLRGMFANCSSLQEPQLTQWNTASIEDMSYMFASTTNFNGDIHSWNTVSVTDMSEMFSGSGFNRPIGQWNTSNVTNMRQMFAWNYKFNQDVGDWDVSSVTDMSDMFSYATVYNQPMASWDTSSVANMSRMFYGSAEFNQDIGSWVVSSVTDMSGMFGNTIAFTQSLASWDTSSVANMDHMFYQASTTNLNLENWPVTSLVSATGMLENTELTVAQYDALLIGWAVQDVNTDVVLNAGTSKYSQGEAADARQHLIEEHNWSIVDGGQAED